MKKNEKIKRSSIYELNFEIIFNSEEYFAEYYNQRDFYLAEKAFKKKKV